MVLMPVSPGVTNSGGQDVDDVEMRRLSGRFVGAATSIFLHALLVFILLKGPATLRGNLDASGASADERSIEVSIITSDRPINRTPDRDTTASPPRPAPDDDIIRTTPRSIAQRAAQGSSTTAVAVKPAPPLTRPTDRTISTPSAHGKSAPEDTSASFQLSWGAGRTGTVSDFQRRLFAHIEPYRSYPDAARQARLEGVVRLTFAMDRNGAILGVWIQQSSGFPVLDHEAIATVLRAQPLLPIPANLPDPLNISMSMGFSMPPVSLATSGRRPARR